MIDFLMGWPELDTWPPMWNYLLPIRDWELQKGMGSGHTPPAIEEAERKKKEAELEKAKAEAEERAALASRPMSVEELRAQLVTVLWSEGIDLSRVDPDSFESALNNLYWSDFVQRSDATLGWGDPDTRGNFAARLRRELFDPSHSSSADSLQWGLQLKASQGHQLSDPQVQALGQYTGLVPTPFDPEFFGSVTQGYGAPVGYFASGMHEGIDYAMPQGTPLYAPFAGTVVAGWAGGYGNQVQVHLDSGYVLSFGHMSELGVGSGQRVNPGDLLGYSGTTGNSTGPHVHVEWRGPDGSPIDPSTVLGPIFQGASFGDIGQLGAYGTGVTQRSIQERYLGIDPLLETKYPAAVSLFEKYFGRRPSGTELLGVLESGDGPDAWEEAIKARPSHIEGISIGTYGVLKSNLDQAMQPVFGHPGTDGMVRELYDQGLTGPHQIKLWLTEQDMAGKMDPTTYNTLWQLNSKYLKAIFNENGFDPRMANRQYVVAGMQPVRRSMASATANRDSESVVRGPLMTPQQAAGERFRRSEREER